MTELRQVYRCNICGNITEVRQTGGGELVCCGQPMELLVPNTVDASQEKHVPVITAADGGVKVTVGQEAHPMEAAHYIKWIEYIVGATSYFQELQPDQAPEALFVGAPIGGQARCYCNIHGHWASIN
jgi:superoxide reductase